MPPLEIIDLTSPSCATDEDSGTGIEPNSSQKQESLKKWKRKAKSNPSATNPQSRQNSLGSQIELTSPRKRRRPEDLSSNVGSDKQVGDADTPNTFFIDLNPTPLPPARQTATETLSEDKQTTEKLLVPSHVTVLGSTPVEIMAQHLPDEDDEDFIDYLDYEDTKPSHRYYDGSSSEIVGPNRTVCKNCGAEGQHKTSACPVQICLTCGVRDEHSTRSCPISKVCFTCGMKGHINASCPNRRSARALMSSQDGECDRCTSSRHKANECPTLWRLYKYFTVEERARTITIRKSKKDFELGQGGEGYVAEDEWCYNCGDYGHWGDDCYDHMQNHFSEEFSAFSNLNIMSGPFYDPSKEARSSSTRPRTREGGKSDTASNWEKDAPNHVGRQARMKSRAALAQQAQQVEDNTDDWFQMASKRNDPPSSGPKEFKKFRFGNFSIETTSHPPTANPPSLMERIGDFHRTGTRRNVDSRLDRSTGRSRKNEEKRSSGRSANWPQRSAAGPRYRGGYSR